MYERSGILHPELDLNQVLASQPACCGLVVTRIDLELKRVATGWRVAGFEGRNLRVAGEAPEPGVSRGTGPFQAKVDRVLDRVVGHVTAPVSVEE